MKAGGDLNLEHKTHTSLSCNVGASLTESGPLVIIAAGQCCGLLVYGTRGRLICPESCQT